MRSLQVLQDIYYIILYHIISYIISYYIISSYIISYIISYHISYHIISYHNISYHIISYHIIYHNISYHIISYHIISYIISYHQKHTYVSLETHLTRGNSLTPSLFFTTSFHLLSMPFLIVSGYNTRLEIPQLVYSLY